MPLSSIAISSGSNPCCNGIRADTMVQMKTDAISIRHHPIILPWGNAVPSPPKSARLPKPKSKPKRHKCFTPPIIWHTPALCPIAVISIFTEPFDLIRCRLPAQGRKSETAPALPISLFKSSLHIKINRQKRPFHVKILYNPLLFQTRGSQSSRADIVQNQN